MRKMFLLNFAIGMWVMLLLIFNPLTLILIRMYGFSFFPGMPVLAAVAALGAWVLIPLNQRIRNRWLLVLLVASAQGYLGLVAQGLVGGGGWVAAFRDPVQALFESPIFWAVAVGSAVLVFPFFLKTKEVKA